jgi:hypothetical protein
MSILYRISKAAQKHAAILRTDLLLERCRSCTPLAGQTADDRSRWYTEQQANLLAWLDAGGFSQTAQTAQTDVAIENSGVAPLFSAPLQDSLRGIEILSTPHHRCG